MAYLLDANVFIQAKNLHYGFDFCPAFWEWVVQGHAAGKIFSVSQVGDELLAGDDDLAEWASDQGGAFFLESDADTLRSLALLSEWVQQQGFQPAAINTFFQIADYYLVGLAHAHGYTVVTHEVPADSVRRIKIPNVCIGMNVRYVTPYDMLRRERARFVLP